MAIFPAPNTTSVGDTYNSQGYSFNQPNNSYEDQFTIRGDYNLNSNNHIFYRHSWQRNYAIDSLNSAMPRSRAERRARRRPPLGSGGRMGLDHQRIADQ